MRIHSVLVGSALRTISTIVLLICAGCASDITDSQKDHTQLKAHGTEAQMDTNCPPLTVTTGEQVENFFKYDVVSNSQGRKIGHSFWGDANRSFMAVYVSLKGGFRGMAFLDHQEGYEIHKLQFDYTFDSPVRSAQDIQLRGKTWPANAIVYRVQRLWVRNKVKVIQGHKCCRVDSIAVDVSDLGRAMGYREGDPLGPPFWAVWQPDDSHAADYVAPYP